MRGYIRVLAVFLLTSALIGASGAASADTGNVTSRFQRSASELLPRPQPASASSARGRSSWSGVKMPSFSSLEANPPTSSTEVTKTFQLTIKGTPPEGESFAVLYQTSDPEQAQGLHVFCGDGSETGAPPPACQGNGTVYSTSIEVKSGTEVAFAFGRLNVNSTSPPEFFRQGDETITHDVTNSAWYDYGAVQTVTKTFELTLNGTVAKGDAFAVGYVTQSVPVVEVKVFCGEAAGAPACEGDGKVYTVTQTFPKGTKIAVVYLRYDAAKDAVSPVFPPQVETLDTDFTNTGYFNYPGAKQPGIPSKLPSTGAGGTFGAAAALAGSVAGR